MQKSLRTIIIAALFVLPFTYVSGSSLSSDNFRILDSGNGGFGGTASSSSESFGLWGTIGDFAIGSSSFTSYFLKAGFLYFPKVIAPTLTTTTAADTQVSLSWIAAQGFQGFSIGEYNACTKPAAGSYTCSSVGLVTSSIVTGLTNGTLYTFKIEAKDSQGDVIATSNEMTATPTGTQGGGGGGGGGGSGGTPTPSYTPSPSGDASVRISGYAYPDATIYLLRDSQRVATVQAGNDGRFAVLSDNLAGGTYKFSIYAIDRGGLQSSLVSLVTTVQAAQTASVDAIVVPPTVGVSKQQYTLTETLAVNGTAFPGAVVRIELSPSLLVGMATANTEGQYSFSWKTVDIGKGVQTVRSKYSIGQLESLFSTTVSFGIDIPYTRPQFSIPKCGELTIPDLNCDGRINIVDVSILLYHFKKPISGDFYADFNGDNTVNIVDFSIMAFYWTG